MKIRLTEYQYNRLLKEDDDSYLDGTYGFPNIGNKIDGFIAKLFVQLNKEGYSANDEFTKGDNNSNPFQNAYFGKVQNRIKLLMGYSSIEAVLLTYNYLITYWNEVDTAIKDEDISSLIGKPLTFYGELKHTCDTAYSGYVSGHGKGVVSSYATDIDDFIDKVSDGYVEIDIGDGEIESNNYTEWEFDSDWSYDMLDNLEIDEDEVYFS